MYGKEKSTNVCYINIFTIFNNKLIGKRESKELAFKINKNQFETTIKMILFYSYSYSLYI